MEIGIVTNGFWMMTGEELARLFADNGFRHIQLFFNQKDYPAFVYNGRPERLDFARAAATIATYRAHGLEVLSLGVYTNLLEPDDAERIACVEYFGDMMRIAADNAVASLATECGFIPGRRGLIKETFEQDWARLTDSFRRLADLAERYDVRVALEPCFHDLVNSAKRARDFIRQIGSDRIGIQIDPGNLITVNTETEMFENLADVTMAVHGKDRRVNAPVGTVVGEGDVDWNRFFELCMQHTPDAPFFLEYVNADNFLQARSYCADRLTRAGQAV